MGLQVPYVWDEHRINWTPYAVRVISPPIDAPMEAVERRVMPPVMRDSQLEELAMSIGGHERYPWSFDHVELTLNVNPDRHARIRAKHFRHAEKKLAGDFTFDHWLERVKDANGGHGDQSGQMRAYAVVETLGKAFDACDWGVS